MIRFGIFIRSNASLKGRPTTRIILVQCVNLPESETCFKVEVRQLQAAFLAAELIDRKPVQGDCILE